MLDMYPLKTKLTSGVVRLNSLESSTRRLRDESLSSWRVANAVAVVSSSFCNTQNGLRYKGAHVGRDGDGVGLCFEES